MRIVVVDDDPSVRALLQAQLELAGHEVHVADDGMAGLRLVQESSPDAVVLDVMMPEASGWQVLEQLRSDPRTARLPVVLLTARNLPDDVRHGYELGASAVLSKPYEEHQLIDVLTTLHNGMLPSR